MGTWMDRGGCVDDVEIGMGGWDGEGGVGEGG